jgi:choline dehydrogenase-like flavoprotein
MSTIRTEILDIGSGFGGAAAALRMAQAGFQVVMVEKGRRIRPERDFQQTQDPQYLLRFIRSIRGDNINFVYGEGLGGGSGFYEMVSLRAPSIAFDQRTRDGRRLWPAGLDRRTLDPYYELAERMMHVKQIEPREIPKSGLAFSLLMKGLGYSVDRVPYSVRGCVGHSYCVAGCTAGAKVTLHGTYLEPACRAGVKILTDIEALSLSTLEGRDSAGSAERNMHRIPFRYRVQCSDSTTGNPLVIDAKIVMLGGGTVGTARLLLNSRSGLTTLSPHVGKNIAVNGTVKSLGILPEDFPDADMFTGRSHPGVISYQFLESRGITISTAKPLPVDAVSYANLVMEGETRTPSWWGAPKVEIMKLYRRRALPIYALGLTTPSAELRPTRRGHVLPSFHLDDEFRTYYRETLELLHSIYRRNGARLVKISILDGEGVAYPDIHVTTAHMTGSCRMADSPRQGVTDATGEVFRNPGLYIVDGAAIPSSLAVNPYLTILANAERIGDLLSRWYTHGEGTLHAAPHQSAPVEIA